MRVTWVVLLLFLLLVVHYAVAQSPNGTISGIVLDPSGGAIPGAAVFIINGATAVAYPGKTNAEGYYVVPNLPPGNYRIQVSNSGFKTIIKPDIVVHVEDALSVNFTLPVGAASVIVTVQGGAPLINTQSAALSTVVDRNFVENMPLNGRSFQDLILLVPGIVTNSPQTNASSGLGYTGEFSVNGQRTESNYYSVDGVSANLGVIPSSPVSAAASGSLPGATALGTTQGLVSVEDLQEFRVQSSTYSAEFGRNPGGQFGFVTRSGTNEWHGSLFDYLRNDVFDANDWFNNFNQQPKPALRQNDFGGTLGGPVEIPKIYNGRDRTFFFFSYEGLRLLQPQPSSVNYVPDDEMRQAAPNVLQPVLNAFPLPTPGRPDLGNGLAEFVGTWSNPSSIDSYSIRLDESLSKSAKLFFRFSSTPSNSQTRGSGNFNSPADVYLSQYLMRTYTGGVTTALTSQIENDLRVNFSSNEVTSHTSSVGGFGGGQSVDLAALQGIDTSANLYADVLFFLLFGGQAPVLSQFREAGHQRQWSIVDSASIGVGQHRLKAGVDYRRLAPYGFPVNPYVQYFYFDAPSVVSNNPSVGLTTNAAAYPLYTNFSAFAQDEWRATPRLGISLGLRWDVNPAPGVTAGNQAYTVTGSSPSNLTLAAPGTQLWKTTRYNFAPRLGAAYVLRSVAGWETVVRGGVGMFYDTGQQMGSLGFEGVGFSQNVSINGAFPVPPSELNVPIPNPPIPPYAGSLVVAFSPHLQLPYTLQWNSTVEQSLGSSQVLGVSYVGAHGAKLLETQQVNVGQFNPNFSQVSFVENGLTSDYNALQVRYQRKLSRGFEALASYTWSHSIDYGSTYRSLPYIRGNSDFDVRHNFAAAFSYAIPGTPKNAFLRMISSNWALDDRFSARTGFPVTLDGEPQIDPITGQTYNGGLNLVPGQSVYLYGSQCIPVYGNPCIGGRSINPNAFTMPPAGSIGDAPRNFVRGFGAWQMDLALRREFPIHERLKLQFRAEAFNIFNHPNFGQIENQYCTPGPGCLFGEATATLASSLGILSPLYQMGGPRSLQLALKLTF